MRINRLVHNRIASVSPVGSLTSEKSMKNNTPIKATPSKIINMHSLNVTPKRIIPNYSQTK